ncbi:MAG: phosphoglucomutase/phosphomannomutase family protein [Anaerolineae bacterium]|jgi:phosphomannomutase|nr:phosphoglucomutase/phosphomannomutase family protein [Anaerolineae bacterium]
MPIHFGTDGWRAVISETFTFHNLRMVTQAIADTLSSKTWNDLSVLEQEPDFKKVVVGFDSRFLSDRYGSEVARVLAANGFKVFLTQSDCPTPAISYAVKHLNAVAGVMITASHNAPRYNGVKVKAAFGGSASPEQCAKVEVYLNDNEEQARGPNLMEYDTAKQEGKIVRFNPIPEYYAHLRKLINFDLFCEEPMHVVVDSMYGSGRGTIKGILQGTAVEVTEIRGDMNPGFGGCHPEPIAKHLGPLMGAIASGLGTVGLATDGDADRIGAMDERGNFVDPHKIMSLAVKHLIEKRGMTGAVVRTISTTRMIDRLAKKHELPIYETPVGFNHIADYMLHEDVLIGGEESGGISFKGHIPEGDGILMGLLVLEMMAASGKPLGVLVDELLDEVGPAFYERRDMRLRYPVSKEAMVNTLINSAPQQIGTEPVADIVTIDGIKYVMGDDSWLLIRPSGTEPVLRVYAEGRSPEMVKALLDFGQQIADTVS